MPGSAQAWGSIFLIDYSGRAVEMMKNHSQRSQINGLYVITPDEVDTDRLIGRCRLALRGGARVLQYRNKAADTALRIRQASRLRELTIEFSVPFIINDDVKLAHQVDADGVHLGGEDVSAMEARMQIGEGKLIGVSCYNRIELAHEAVRAKADYVAFGSFFASTVKPDAVSASADLLRRARNEIDVPLVAIGGITPFNGASLLEAGANALAVISAVYAAVDVEAAAQQFSNLNYPETIYRRK